MKSAMYYLFLLVLVFSSNVVSEVCKTFNFENGLQDFNNEGDICGTFAMWELGKYSNLSMDGFHPKSSVYAFPLSPLSCMSSPMFQMKAGGTLEINVYLKPNVLKYQLVVIISQYIKDGQDAAVLAQNLILTEGWQSMNLAVKGFDSYLGYVTFMSTADPSTLLVDSFRYIPPLTNEENCQIYKDVEVKDPEEDKKSSYSIFNMFKMRMVKMFNELLL